MAALKYALCFDSKTRLSLLRNLSDYIGFVLTKGMTGANLPPNPKESAEYRELAQLLRGTKLALQNYETALAPFAKQWQRINQDALPFVSSTNSKPVTQNSKLT